MGGGLNGLVNGIGIASVIVSLIIIGCYAAVHFLIGNKVIKGVVTCGYFGLLFLGSISGVFGGGILNILCSLVNLASYAAMIALGAVFLFGIGGGLKDTLGKLYMAPAAGIALTTVIGFVRNLLLWIRGFEVSIVWLIVGLIISAVQIAVYFITAQKMVQE